MKTKNFVGCARWTTSLLFAGLAVVASGAQNCGFPGRPAYGRISLIRDSYERGQTVSYSCDSGFNLLGQSARQCLDNGTWSGTLPVCDTSLSVQRIPEASGYLYAYPPVNALDGSKSSCFYTSYQPPRWWRIDLGAAYHVLSVALTVPHVSSRQDLEVKIVSYEGSKAVFNRCAAFSGKFSTQTIVLMCDEGKGIIGQYVHVADKRKDPDHFSLCEVEIYVLREKYQCGDPDKPPKSYTVPLSPQQMEYRCISGYKLSGPSVRTCLESGQWSAEAPKCLEAACPSLGPLENGKVAVRGTSNGRMVQGSQLIYTCDPGYTLEGNDTRTCLEDARWGGTQPHCQPVTCDVPSFEVDGGTYTLLNVSTNYGDLAELNCHLGYERQGGPTTIICQEDGTWSEPQALCLAIEMKQKLKKQLPGSASDTSSTLTGMVAAIIAIVFLFLLSMCVLLILKKKKYFSRAKGQPAKPPGAGLAASNGSANNGSANISYTDSSGTIYQNEDFYMEIPLKSATQQNGSTAGAAHNNNHITAAGGHRASLKAEGGGDRRKSLTPSRKSSLSSKENIYEEIALASKHRRLSFGGVTSITAGPTPSAGVTVVHSELPPSSADDDKPENGDSSPALYAKVDFDQKRKSRLIREQNDEPSNKPAPPSGVKLRDLPPIPPPDEDEDYQNPSVAMSLVGAVVPLVSLAPHVVEGDNVYVDHPLGAEMVRGTMHTGLVDNELYATSGHS
ncbi:complement receptor type 2-like isoform X2 [Amblyomma americanum]